MDNFLGTQFLQSPPQWVVYFSLVNRRWVRGIESCDDAPTTTIGYEYIVIW